MLLPIVVAMRPVSVRCSAARLSSSVGRKAAWWMSHRRARVAHPWPAARRRKLHLRCASLHILGSSAAPRARSPQPRATSTRRTAHSHHHHQTNARPPSAWSHGTVATVTDMGFRSTPAVQARAVLARTMEHCEVAAVLVQLVVERDADEAGERHDRSVQVRVVRMWAGMNRHAIHVAVPIPR